MNKDYKNDKHEFLKELYGCKHLDDCHRQAVKKEDMEASAELVPKDIDKVAKCLKAQSSQYDPNGSYTGTAQDGSKPVQDADDL